MDLVKPISMEVLEALGQRTMFAKSRGNKVKPLNRGAPDKL